MNEPSDAVPPYRVVYSDRRRAHVKQLLERASQQGRFAELAQAIRDIDTRLHWVPLDFGEPLQDYLELRIVELVGVVSPLVVKYGIDEDRRIVYISLPFGLLPKSGL